MNFFDAPGMGDLGRDPWFGREFTFSTGRTRRITAPSVPKPGPVKPMPVPMPIRRPSIPRPVVPPPARVIAIRPPVVRPPGAKPPPAAPPPPPPPPVVKKVAKTVVAATRKRLPAISSSLAAKIASGVIVYAKDMPKGSFKVGPVAERTTEILEEKSKTSGWLLAALAAGGTYMAMKGG